MKSENIWNKGGKIKSNDLLVSLCHPNTPVKNTGGFTAEGCRDHAGV